MPFRTTARTADVSRDKLFWAIASAMVVGQLVAFWMLCSHQVRKAEVRHATAQVERMAVADCLRYIPDATLDSCVGEHRAAGPWLRPMRRSRTSRRPGTRRRRGGEQRHAGELRLPLSNLLLAGGRAAGCVFRAHAPRPMSESGSRWRPTAPRNEHRRTPAVRHLA